ncbi:MAG: enoyl-CoA hydratase/isomerase family protein [Thermoflavifilum sp.]|nr:enoyl-CoA hydratase/isomerase family protein [Thermoflavifilum sp.]MCL6513156.1 enoyl-CoA hydratase/isomerase family protein [Alicyclobacillus sp.]
MVTGEALVRVEIQSGVAEVVLNRPKQLNALNEAVLTTLHEVLHRVAYDNSVRAVILRGEGRAFAAGADIAQMRDFDAVRAEQFARLGQQVFLQLERMPQPTLALVQGYALGGGMELAMACDVRYAAEGAKFGQPEITLGVIPGFGGSQRLPRIVGQGRALELMLSGEMIDAQEAWRMGLVNKVVPAEELLEAGRAWAQRMVGLAPKAHALIKRAVYDGAELDLERGLAHEAVLFGLCFATEDQKEGMDAFLEKRPAKFSGR